MSYTEDDDEKEVNVGDVMELKVQILGYEAEWGVFGSPDLVPCVLLLNMALLVYCICRQGNVHVDCSSVRLGFSRWVFSGSIFGVRTELRIVRLA
jgi:hypothetical protein